ncbi:MAG: TolC family protein [Sphingobacteriales bacterium]|nr:TolC family protein [Sphingobacteriales bacterium]
MRVLVQCAFLLSIFIGPNSFGQEAWSLQRCVNYALEHNLSVLRAEVSAELSATTVQQSRFALFPTLNGSAARNWNFGYTIDPYTNDFTTGQVTSDNFSLNSAATLFGGFQLRRALQQSSLEYLAAGQDVRKIKNDISLNVVSAYLQVVYAKEQRKVAEGRVQQAQQQCDRLKRMVENGMAVQGNLLDADAQRASEELALVSAVNQVELAKLALAQLLQLDQAAGFDVEDPLIAAPDSGLKQKSVDEITAIALSALPEMKAAEYRLRGAEKGVSAAQGGLYPRLTAFGQVSTFYASSAKRFAGVDTLGIVPIGATASGELVYAPTFRSRFETNPFDEQVNQNLNKVFGLSLNVPLFNGASSRLALRRARLNLESARLNHSGIKNQISQSVQQADADMRAAKARYRSSTDALSAFEAAFGYASRRYDGGLINSLEYLTALNNLTRAKIDSLQARYDYIFRMKVLDFYAGIPLTL